MRKPATTCLSDANFFYTVDRNRSNSAIVNTKSESIYALCKDMYKSKFGFENNGNNTLHNVFCRRRGEIFFIGSDDDFILLC